MEQLEQLLNGAPPTHIPIAFFMTDGGCSDSGASKTLKRIMSAHEMKGYAIWLKYFF
jgi:hypothetical protein